MLGMPKRISLAEVKSISEKIKPIALAIIELHLSGGISSGSQPAENSTE